jgi:methyl-accepting chemotaxis protein
MQELLGMLQGLGTKFKTSTWGILGFISLKAVSELTRFDEKRLAWVIGKVKTELERRKQAQSVAEDAKQLALFAQIDGGAQKIVKGFAEQVAQLMERDKVLHQHTLHYLDKVVKAVREDIGQVRDETRAMNTAMTQFTESTQGIVEKMAAAAQRMAGGADKVGNAADNLVNAVDAFESKFTDVLNNVRKDLGKAINDMSTQASETLERGSKQLGEATREISKALGVLSEDVKGTMSEVKNSITKALEIQQRAANEFTISSNNLNENIAVTTGMVDKLGKPIEDGLRSVSASGEHMRGIGKTLEKSIKIMEDVVGRLSELPSALEPLKTLSNKQQAMIAVLEHLDAALPTQQQAILKELHGLREDMKSRTVVAATATLN